MKSEFKVEVKTFNQNNVVSVRTVDSLYSMGSYIRKLYRIASRNKLKPKGHIFTIYYSDVDNPKEVDYEMHLPVDKDIDTDSFSTKVIGGEECVYLRVKGSYNKLGKAYQAIIDYVNEYNYEIIKPPREVYVRGPLLGFLFFIPTMITDIYFPIKKKEIY